MAILRLNNSILETEFDLRQFDGNKDEWTDASRINEPDWTKRYEYESSIIIDAISDKKIYNILEIGSGPGILSQKIQFKLKYNVNYHLIDKLSAKIYFEENNFKGKFFVKDISLDLDTTDLLPKYDLIICNDVLEHVFCPANIVKKTYELMFDNSIFFVSVPNWRMEHQFIYRGLFDYDNFVYFMYIFRLKMSKVYQSFLKTVSYPRLNSEESMPDDLLNSWNFYFVCQKDI